jgi:hypothetical protein
MSIELRLECPDFLCEQDELAFFGWLKGLPDLQQAIGAGRLLHLQFLSTPSPESLQQLQLICQRWGVSTAPLRPYLTDRSRR